MSGALCDVADLLSSRLVCRRVINSGINYSPYCNLSPHVTHVVARGRDDRRMGSSAWTTRSTHCRDVWKRAPEARTARSTHVVATCVGTLVGRPCTLALARLASTGYCVLYCVQGWAASSVSFWSGNACTALARCTRLALSMDLKDPERSAREARAIPSP